MRRGIPGVTVVTPSLPERADLLVEAIRSVQAQDMPGVQHFIRLDAPDARIGPAASRNEMLERVDTPYVAFLDDDDLMDADHLSSLLVVLEEHAASVAYSWPRVEGVNAVLVPRPKTISQVWRTMLGGRNVIPVTVLAKTSAIRAGGCFNPTDRYEDYMLWLRLHALGHKFALLPRETWTYRFLGENRTHE